MYLKRAQVNANITSQNKYLSFKTAITTAFKIYKEEFYTLTNILNGKMAEIRSKAGPAPEPRKALISFVCETVEDLNRFGSRIETFGGRIVRGALEVAPGTTILWGQDPSGLHFGLTTLNHNYG